MEYKSLYRKWRPKTFADVFGQEHITRVLENQVAGGKVSHAYLFCGSRGTGKTTCAKIMAKAANCERAPEMGGNPCNECDACAGIENGGIIDVIEIDAASNNGVDNIREIREEAAFTPSAAAKKVYIIDEVHMLSIGAFNALLKTLEEPPPHVIFILATTEMHKVPATILSRCQRHDFRRIAPEIIAQRLRIVCEGEGIEIEGRALGLIARLSGGAMRDALSILEAARADHEITADHVAKIAGHFDSTEIVKICGCVKNKDAAGALAIFWELYEGSLDCANFCGSLLEALRDIQVAKITGGAGDYINADERAGIIELAQGFSGAELARCYGLAGDALTKLGRYTANKRVAVEMLLCEMCLGAEAAPPQSEAAPAIKPAPVKRAPQPGAFGAYADMLEQMAEENKIAAHNLKGTSCYMMDGGLVIKTDSEFKAEMAQVNLEIIKKYAAMFAGDGCEVTVELEARPGGSGNSIDDIKIDDIKA